MSGHESQSLPSTVADSPVRELTPERWQQVKNIFAAAQERDRSERSAFLTEACGPDEALRAEVESLLGAADREPADSPGADAHPDPMMGQRIGAYKIEKQIGRGGMATVYLASRADEEYQRRVAVKVLLPELDNEELMRRFRSERQTLATLDHPNIVKLLDGGTTEQGLPYLVMDYVEGEPIDEYCDRHKLSTEGRLRLFLQVCFAVQCAHENHVVHRDLKPSNILVTPQGVPKLLDFGISKVLEPSTASQALVTQTRTRRMTPAYASPEQVKAEHVTAATDVYSLGVVLYELLTGHRPYKLKQQSPAEIERAICEEDPEKPSTAVDRVETASTVEGTTVSKTPETVSQTREGHPDKLRRCLRGDLDTILLVALQKERERRYSSVLAFSEDIQRHLDHLPVTARRPTLAYRSSKFFRRHKAEVVTAGVAMLLVGAGILLLRWEERRAAERTRTEAAIAYAPGRRSVAVLGFKNLSGRSETSWISTALSEMLTTELSAGGKLRMISGENVARMKTDLSLPETDSLTRETLSRVRSNLGSDYVVLGSYLDVGGTSDRSVRLDLRLQDAVAGETVAAVAFNGSEQDLVSLIVQAGGSLRDKLGAGAASPEDTNKVRATQSANLEAARDYAEGVTKLRGFDSRGARELLEKAIALDPGYAMAHSALADALANMGYDAQATAEAKKAFDLSVNLPREQSLLIEGHSEETAHQWDKAIEAYRTLFNFFPDNLDYGLRLIEAEISAGKGNDSLAAIETLRKLPAPLRDDPRVDLVEANAAGAISDYKRQAAAAAQAERQGQALGQRDLVARAELEEARAFRALGDPKGALAATQKAAQFFQAAGDRYGEAHARRNVGVLSGDLGPLQESLQIVRELGNRLGEEDALGQIASIKYGKGDYAGAKESIQQSLTIARELGNRVGEGGNLNILGGVEEQLGEIAQAKADYERALKIDREVGNLGGATRVLNNLGNLLMNQGDYAGASRTLAECIALSRQTGAKDNLGIALMNLAGLRFNHGEVAASKKLFTESLQLLRETRNQGAAAYAMAALADIAATEGDLESGRKGQEEALALREKIGAKDDAASSRQSLASIALEQRRLADGEKLSRQAAEAFHAAGDLGNEGEADRYLAQALREEGNLSNAQSVIETAKKLVDQHGVGPESQVPVAIEYARVHAALGHTTAAVKLLQSTIADAQKGSFIHFLMEARLALGEIEIASGDRASGEKELNSLERDARTRGFLLVARKAAADRRHSKLASGKDQH